MCPTDCECSKSWKGLWGCQRKDFINCGWEYKGSPPKVDMFSSVAVDSLHLTTPLCKWQIPKKNRLSLFSSVTQITILFGRDFKKVLCVAYINELYQSQYKETLGSKEF